MILATEMENADSSLNANGAWYLVYTKPQQERVARDNLQRQGYHVYLPLIRKRIRRGRAFHFRTDPLFPRYIFIRLSEGLDDWGPIRSTIGVTHLVRFGEKAAMLPEQLIQVLQRNESEEGFWQMPEKTIKPGEKVRFVEGSLSGYEAVYECQNSAERVIVLMDIAGKHSRLSVSVASIEPVAES